MRKNYAIENNDSIPRRKKKRFSPDRQYIAKATDEYLKRGGRITKIETPKVTGDEFDFYFPKNLTNDYGW